MSKKGRQTSAVMKTITKALAKFYVDLCAVCVYGCMFVHKCINRCDFVFKLDRQ